MRSPVKPALILGTAAVAILGGLCGWLGYRAYQADAEQRFERLVVQVGKQAAANLTTIDYERVEADVQRILDSATGEFYDDFAGRSRPLIDVVQKVQSKSVGTVSEAGLESVDGRQARVLVAVTVSTSSGVSRDEQPRFWRMRLTVVGDGDDAKVSKVDFVP